MDNVTITADNYVLDPEGWKMTSDKKAAFSVAAEIIFYKRIDEQMMTEFTRSPPITLDCQLWLHIFIVMFRKWYVYKF